MIMENSAGSNDKRGAHFGVASFRELTEKSLVEAAKAGQTAAFAALCERYTQQLLGVAHRVTRNHEDSEDAVQDALLSAFVHLGNFDGRSSFATWLTRIAINSSLMILRKKRASYEVGVVSIDDPGEDGRAFQIADRAPNPERRCAKSEEERILKKAIDKLRPTLREVVEIQLLQERSMRETAKVMRISVSAAKGRLFHAKAALRRSSILKLMNRSQNGGECPVLSAA